MKSEASQQKRSQMSRLFTVFAHLSARGALPAEKKNSMYGNIAHWVNQVFWYRKQSCFYCKTSSLGPIGTGVGPRWAAV